ncbi:MAG TPA: nuclear transport factor 2 family protein [Bacteroidales bacterium]|nr:nuclear transport factor 2 family protein [Bacteroidales bacterium]
MKKQSLLICVFVFSISTLFAQSIDKEIEAIKKIIQTAYVDGLQNKGSVADIEQGFHPGFNLLGVRDNMLTKFPIYSWINSHKKRLAADPSPPTDEQKITCKFLDIDVTGNAAMAKIELYRNQQLLFTDYLQLYKFDEGWQVVSKIYYRH